MFSAFRRKRHDPEAIARAVLNAATDPSIVDNFFNEFASSDEQFSRVLFCVIVYAYCWTRGWALGKNDAKVRDAYERAAEIIVSRFKSGEKLVRVSDYVVSEFEMTQLLLDLFYYFRERIPLMFDPALDALAQLYADKAAIRSHEIPFNTLARAVIAMRNKRMAEDVSESAAKDIPYMLTVLSGTLYEQIRGAMRADIALTPTLYCEIAAPRKQMAITFLMSRLETELEAL
jgi:hypothetical protein